MREQEALDCDDPLVSRRVFHLLFRRESFTLRDGATSTFLEEALAEGRRYEDCSTFCVAGVG